VSVGFVCCGTGSCYVAQAGLLEIFLPSMCHHIQPKNLQIELSYDPATPLMSIYPKQFKQKLEEIFVYL
jgi:hypothetical protein